MTNFIIDNSYVFYGLYATTVGFISYKFISSFSTVIETPNSPQTFNFTPQQLREINKLMDEGGVLNQETQVKLDEDLQTIMGKEDYTKMMAELQQIQDDSIKQINEILSQEFQNIHCPLESEDILPIIPWEILNNLCENHILFLNESKLFLDILNNLF